MRRDNALFAVALLVATSLSLVDAKTRTKKNDQQDVPSLARGSSIALPTTLRPSTNAVRVRPNDEEEDHYFIGSFQMKESTSSLADHLATLSSSDQGNEFANRLLQEQEQGDSATASAVCTTSASTSLVWTVLGGSALLLLSSQLLLSPSSTSTIAAMGQDLWTAAQAALSVNWLPWMWIRSSSTATATSDLITYVQLFAKVELLEYMWTNIAPLSFQSFRRMLVAELWNRFWTATFRQVALLFPPSPSSSSSSSSSSTSQSTPAATCPAWLAASHSFLVGTIQRGTKKIFQTTLQKHLQESIDSFSQATYTAARDLVLLVSTTSTGDGSAYSTTS
jgi:hypothetical protein